MYVWVGGGEGDEIFRGTGNLNKIDPRERGYDFKNIFAEKVCEKIGVFDSKQS
jgi:hypothetical protein